jgi:glutathione S-transferase
MVLHRCGLVVERRDHETWEAEWKTLTPAGTVPILCIDGLVMTDSSVMLEYLNDRFGGLWPASPALAASARTHAIAADRGVGAAVRDLVFECRDRPSESWDSATIDQAVAHWQEAMPGLEQALGEEDYFVLGAGITDYVVATRFGLAMAYGMPRPDSERLDAWYNRICRRSEFLATAPPRVVATFDRGWQA